MVLVFLSSRQFDFFWHFCDKTKLFQHVSIYHRGAVVDKVTAYQHCKHKDSHIVIYSFFSVSKALGIDKDYIDSFSVLSLAWNSLVPHPETLCAGCGRVAYHEATRFSNQAVDDVRFSATIFSSNSDHSYRSLNSVEEFLGVFADNKLVFIVESDELDCFALGFWWYHVSDF